MDIGLKKWVDETWRKQQQQSRKMKHLQQPQLMTWLFVKCQFTGATNTSRKHNKSPSKEMETRGLASGVKASFLAGVDGNELPDSSVVLCGLQHHGHTPTQWMWLTGTQTESSFPSPQTLINPLQIAKSSLVVIRPFLFDFASALSEKFAEEKQAMLGRISKRGFCSNLRKPWLFVGLGNPGDKFKGTRHNVGFEMMDTFSESIGIPVNTAHCKALFGQGFIDDVPVFLAKPQTYMNLSGESSGPLAAYYKMPLNRIVVFHDDMELPCGVLRLQPRGGHGSHNGLKSVIHHFRGNREFIRLRIGIGRPPGQMDPKAFLLQKFNAAARERIDVALKEGAIALKLFVSKGFTAITVGCFNQEQKYKHLRSPTMQQDTKTVAYIDNL
ncbi:hypothetical protein Dimus_000043 [Dionaea muscipula]